MPTETTDATQYTGGINVPEPLWYLLADISDPGDGGGYINERAVDDYAAKVLDQHVRDHLRHIEHLETERERGVPFAFFMDWIRDHGAPTWSWFCDTRPFPASLKDAHRSAKKAAKRWLELYQADQAQQPAEAEA